MMVGCRSPKMPAIEITAWIGDSAKSGITRSSEERTIRCNDIQFDEYVCITGADLSKIYNTMLQCTKWGAPISTGATRSLLIQNKDVVEHLVK
jgi:hypothetical protein